MSLMGQMGRLGTLAAAALAVLVAGAGAAFAEPYMAVREGLRCGGCHTNMTGGGKRRELVVVHARDILRYSNHLKELEKGVESFKGTLSEHLSLGGNIRLANTAVFQDRDDGDVDNDRYWRGRLEENRMEVSEAVAFVELQLIPEKLTFYVDQRFAPSTSSREVFGLLRGLPLDGYVKAGKMFLPYGLQLQDDTAFIRGGRNGSATTDFSFEQQQAAFEVGVEPGPFSVAVAISEGAPRDRDMQVTATAYGLWSEVPLLEHLLLGGSISRSGPPGSQSVVFGFFAGTNLGPLTILTESDFRKDKTPLTGGKYRGTFIHYTEGNLLLFEHLNVKLAFDYADDDGDLSSRRDDAEHRISFGLEPFWNRYLQTRLYYRVSNGVRSDASHNQNVAMAEAHIFF